MRTLFLLIKNVWKQTFARKIMYPAYFLAPPILFLAAMLLFGSEVTPPRKLGISNEKESTAALFLIDALSSGDKYSIDFFELNEGKDAVTKELISNLLRIPSDVDKKIFSKEKNFIKLYNLKGLEQSWSLTADVNRFVEIYRKLQNLAKQTEQNVSVYTDQYLDSKYKIIQEKVENKNNSKFISLQGLGFVLMFILFQALGVTRILGKERRLGTFSRVLTGPVKNSLYTLSNIIAALLIISIQIAVSLTAAHFLLNVHFAVPAGQLILILLIFSICAVTLGLMIMGITNDEMRAADLSTLIITPTCMLGGCFWPISMMPKVMQTLSGLTPQHWVLKSLEQLQNGSSLGDVIINIAILAAFALLFASVYIFSIKRQKMA